MKTLNKDKIIMKKEDKSIVVNNIKQKNMIKIISKIIKSSTNNHIITKIIMAKKLNRRSTKNILEVVEVEEIAIEVVITQEVLSNILAHNNLVEDKDFKRISINNKIFKKEKNNNLHVGMITKTFKNIIMNKNNYILINPIHKINMNNMLRMMLNIIKRANIKILIKIVRINLIRTTIRKINKNIMMKK